MQFSKFGEKFTSGAGILSLMDDLGNALSVNRNMLMLGGGNPGHIPEVEALVIKHLEKKLEDPDQFHQLIGLYDTPQGDRTFIRALANLFQKQYGWHITEEHICLTNGSQSAFFMLFNLLAGTQSDSTFRKIQLPLTPEYIGYADAGVEENIFIASKPRIEFLKHPFYKYYIDFDHLEISKDTAAICLSRPTNPTGNVLTDEEIHKLDRLAKSHNIPLIIDNAYGLPFPQIVYKDVRPFWNENTIVCMSLSKLGLPAVRTGIVIAHPEIVQALAGMNAIMALSPAGIGSRLATPLIESEEIFSISENVVQPFYRAKMEKAVAWIRESFQGFQYHIHQPEGAMFLWLWFPDLPVSGLALYERLKAAGVLVVSGHYFFPGLQEEWPHQHQCIRMTYSQSDEVVKAGIEVIGRVVGEVS